VDHVQITVAESIGVEHRAAFYEETGVVRDIVQNHLLQVLALVAMEPPAAFEPEAVRDEKAKLLRAMRPMSFQDAVRGQYDGGYVAGEEVPAYTEEPEVPADSNTPTYIAAKLEIDNWRWAGTPFYIRSGKRLAKRVTEVAVQFRRPPHLPFSREASEHLEANSLVLRIQPDEGISLRFGAKAPTPTLSIRSVNMDFLYGSSFLSDVPEAYETLLLDAIRGDSTLFTRQDSVERAWQICDPLIEQWQTGQPQPYAAGSWGPDAADELMARDGRCRARAGRAARRRQPGQRPRHHAQPGDHLQQRRGCGGHRAGAGGDRREPAAAGDRYQPLRWQAEGARGEHLLDRRRAAGVHGAHRHPRGTRRAAERRPGAARRRPARVPLVAGEHPRPR
jgi:glucose-6-phosphate 1-dehydrogenase